MTTTATPLELPELAPDGVNLQITNTERAAIDNDGVCLSLLSYFRTRDLTKRRPGGFVTAILANDFLSAMNNRGVSWEAIEALRAILNRCPFEAFGSYAALSHWPKSAQPDDGWYAGQAIDLQKRWQNHERYRLLAEAGATHIRWWITPRQLLRQTEALVIAQLNPEHNRNLRLPKTLA